MLQARNWSAVALSGPVCAGKTTLAWNLAKDVGARPLTTRVLLAARAGRDADDLDRRRLQSLGESLDRAEGGHWVASALRSLLATDPTGGVAVIDAVRTNDQAQAVAQLVPTLRVHLTAPLAVLMARYEERRSQQPAIELSSFQEVRENATESAIEALARDADLVIDTARHSPDAVRDAVIARLGTGGH